MKKSRMLRIALQMALLTLVLLAVLQPLLPPIKNGAIVIQNLRTGGESKTLGEVFLVEESLFSKRLTKVASDFVVINEEFFWLRDSSAAEANPARVDAKPPEDELTATVEEPQDWKKPVLENVVFAAKTKGIDEILGKNDHADHGPWTGFVVFSCTAKESLSKRLLWIDAEVEFSNGYKRKFKGITFDLPSQGTGYDIAKIPFEVESPVTLKSVRVSSVTIK